MAAGDGAAQSFQGGLRGTVQDPQGIIPGASVTPHESRVGRVTRHGHQRGRRVLVPECAARHLHHQGGGRRLQDLRTQGRTNWHAAIPHAGHRARGRRDRGTDHGDGRVAVDRNLERVDRRRARQDDARDVAEHQPHGVSGQQHRPDGDLHRQSAHEPDAGSDRSVTAGAGRRHLGRQQLPARRLSNHRRAESGVSEPEHRGPRGRQGPGAHLRRGDGPDRRRDVQCDRQVGHQPHVWRGVSADAPRLAHRAELLPQAAERAQREAVLAQCGWRRWRARHQEQDVLLVRGRRLSGRPVAERQPARAHRGRAQRRFFGAHRLERSARSSFTIRSRPIP